MSPFQFWYYRGQSMWTYLWCCVCLLNWGKVDRCKHWHQVFRVLHAWDWIPQLMIMVYIFILLNENWVWPLPSRVQLEETWQQMVNIVGLDWKLLTNIGAHDCPSYPWGVTVILTVDVPSMCPSLHTNQKCAELLFAHMLQHQLL